MQTNLNLSVMELAFSFAKKINDIEFVNTVLASSYDRFVLGIYPFTLRFSNPTIGLHGDCIKHQKRKGFAIVAEYLYYRLMYKSPNLVGIHDYLPDPIESGPILLDVRDLKAKYKSIASFVGRLHSIFVLPEFNRILRLIGIPDFDASIENEVVYCDVTIGFNYLSHTVIKLYTEPNTVIKILTYLLLLR